MAIKKIAVIGAGVMGMGIAAHVANAGYEVELLDRVDPKNPDRDGIAKGAIDRALKDKKMPPFMHKKNARRVRPGNTEDHMDRLKDVDLIIEVVFEDPKVKHDIFKKIDANRKPGAIVASNTSTIPLKNLVEGQSEQFKKDFVITHFFNPPRFMRLLELITSKDNSPETVAEISRFMDEKLGKGVVVCNDTPGFIANRIGTFWLQTAVNEAFDKKLTVEEADATIGSKALGIPKTGIFSLIDFVGVDLMPKISASLLSKLPAEDAYCQSNKTYPVIDQMIKDGFTGNKSPKGGFYRRDENKQKLAVDLENGSARPSSKPKIAAVEASKKAVKKGGSVAGMRALFENKDKTGAYAWSVMKKSLCYAVEHAHDISSGVQAVDEAMKLGYGWKMGPFEMIDKMGVDYFIGRLKADGDAVPAFLEKAAGRSFYRTEGGKLQFLNKEGAYEAVARPEGVLLLSDIKRASKPVLSSGVLAKKLEMGADVWDIGDGVLCLEFTSKMNSLDFFTMKTLHKALDLIETGKYKALVVHNEAEDFSLGANLGLATIAAKTKQFWVIDKMVKAGQDAYKRLKYFKHPVVSAPSGKALGGGCEILLHSHHVQAHAELYPGLVEIGVGLLPAWGGCAELLTRAKQNKKMPGGPIPAAAKVFEIISMAQVAMSAQEAKDLMYLRDSDGITMNKARLLFDAKKKAIEMTKDFKPEAPLDMQLPGPAGHAAFSMAVENNYLAGKITPYDVVVSDKVAKVLTGGDCADTGVILTQDYIRALERQHFMELARDPRTLNRIVKTLTGGGRKEYEKEEQKARGPQRASEIREEGTQQGFFARIFKGKSAQKAFGRVCDKSANDNKNLTRDTKAQMNWPKK